MDGVVSPIRKWAEAILAWLRRTPRSAMYRNPQTGVCVRRPDGCAPPSVGKGHRIRPIGAEKGPSFQRFSSGRTGSAGRSRPADPVRPIYVRGYRATHSRWCLTLQRAFAFFGGALAGHLRQYEDRGGDRFVGQACLLNCRLLQMAEHYMRKLRPPIPE